MVGSDQAEDAFGEQSPKEEASEGIKADFMLLGLKYEKKDAIHHEEK